MSRETNKTYYIYGHWTKDTNELFYIGVGTGERIHNKSGRNKYWKNIANKHSYTAHIILNNFTDRNEAVKEEVRLQKLNSPRACIQYGDRLHSIVSKETREKLSEVRMGNKNHFYGKAHTEETKKVIGEKASKRLVGNSYCKNYKWTDVQKKQGSLSHTGNKHSQETKDKIGRAHKGKSVSEITISKARETRYKNLPTFHAIDKNGNRKGAYKSIKECAIELFNNSAAASNISNILKKYKNNKTYKGFTFEYTT